MNTSIQFTMELEEDGRLPFLDVLVEKKDHRLGHAVYRKPTHTDRYLHANSHHHPAQKEGVINTLLNRAELLSEPTNLPKERRHLRTAFRKNGYEPQMFDKVLRKRNRQRSRIKREPEETRGQTTLPYVKGTSEKIARILKRHKIRTTYSTDRKMPTFSQA